MLSEHAWRSSGDVETVSLSKNSTYAIDLHDGWNIVSNPFGVGVDWTAVQEANGVTQALWRWNGSYQEASSFTSAQTGRAYYFFNEQGLDELKLPYPTGSSSSGTDAPAAQTQSVGTQAAPTLTLRAHTEDDSLSSSVAVGLAKNAEDGFDARDQYAPPGAFATTQLHLAAPFEAESGHDRLAAEYRPADEESQRFEVVLQTNEVDQPVTLTAETLDAFADQQVVLIDQRTLRRHDLHERRAVQINPQQKTTRFALLVGSAAFVEQEGDEMTPEESQLLGNYPNPFQARTTIAYTVAEPSAVRLTVYDLRGRRVRTLVDEQQEPGREEALLDARGLSSGVYVYRLTVGDYTETSKVVLVR
jgi:hypothetical protein